jgi:hypothetical protein
MTYIFTTLAVGNSYVLNALQSFERLSKLLPNASFNITTTSDVKHNLINIDRFKLDKLTDSGPGFAFHLNLKSLALKYCIDKSFDMIVYLDADWCPTEKLSEDNFNNLYNYMLSNNIDMLCERPAQIGYYKNKPYECFFNEKLIDYRVKEHDYWDEAHVFNEQILIFKNNYKFNFFANRWEQFLWWTVANNIRNYPDGFEIGVSALDAKMKYDFDQWRTLAQGIFKFKDKQGNEHIRF